MNTDILEYIDQITFRSEIDVLMAVCESYEKALAIIANEDYSDKIIQESFSIYMEDGESGFSIKALFKKVIMFFKNVCAKLKGIISRCFDFNKKRYIQSYNTLMIVNELGNVFSNKVVNEWLSDEISDEVFQEALFDRKSSQEKEEEEYMKGQVAREKEINQNMDTKEKNLEKNTKINEAELKKYVTTLRKQVYCDDKFTRLLNKQDVERIVRVTCLGASKEELRKLRDAVNQIKNTGNFEGIDKKMFDTLKMTINVGESFGKVKEEGRHHIKPNVVIPSNVKREAESRINRDNTEKTVMHDIGLLEKFSDTFGAALNELAGRDYFSEENLKAIIYGPQKIITIPATAAGFVLSTVTNLLTKTAYALATFNPKAIYNDITEFGKMMDVVDDEFSKFADDDTKLRKEYGVKLNKTMTVTRVAVLDNIKEETYRWEDCPFNTLAYGRGNMMAAIAGGPITLTVILVATIFFHRPLEDFYPGPGLLGMMGLVRLLNPGRSGKFLNMAGIGG